MMITDPGPEVCVYCDAISAQRVTCESPKVEAWWCPVCDGRWWFSAVNPQHYLNRLTGEVAARALLRDVEALVKQSPGMSDEGLRVRLLTLLITLAQHAKTPPG